MSSDKVALITPKGKKEMTVLISISAPVIATVTSIFASTALFACIFISIIYNFEESTATHCKVRFYMLLRFLTRYSKLFIYYMYSKLFIFKYNSFNMINITIENYLTFNIHNDY